MRIRIGTLCLLCVIGATEVAFSAEALTAGERTQVKGAALTPGKKCVKEDCTACTDLLACGLRQVGSAWLCTSKQMRDAAIKKGHCVDRPDCNVSCATTTVMCMWQAWHYPVNGECDCSEERDGVAICPYGSCNGIQIGQCD